MVSVHRQSQYQGMKMRGYIDTGETESFTASSYNLVYVSELKLTEIKNFIFFVLILNSIFPIKDFFIFRIVLDTI